MVQLHYHTFILSITLISFFGAQRMKLGPSDRIVFLGDSITEQGDEPKGYVCLIRDKLARKFPGITVIGAGISGNKVPQLQERLDRDVMAKNPTIVVIYVGINDVWHFTKHGTGTPKDVYDSGLREIIARIRKSGVRVILCTPSVIGEKKRGENPFDAMLDEYSEISGNVAKDLNVEWCDLRKAFFRYLASHNPKNLESGILTRDGVHLNDEGNRLVSRTILKVLSD